MDSRHKELIRKKIEEAITATEQNIVSLKELTRPIEPDVSIGRLTRMEAIGSKSINEAALNIAITKLTKLKFALANIDKPDFGICVECGEPIPA